MAELALHHFKRVLVAEFELHHRKRVLVAELELHHCKRVLVADLELHHCKIVLVAELPLHHFKRVLVAEFELQQDQKYEELTFDLKKTLPTPCIPTGIVYYKRKLWTCNLVIHSLRDNTASMFMSKEGCAKKEANDIGSCVYKHIQRLSERG